MKKFWMILICCVVILPTLVKGQVDPIEITYKTVDTTTLKMHLFYPPGFVKGKNLPAIVLFFGGSWTTGNIKQLEPQARRFAAAGLIAVTADYRVKSRQHTTPFEAVNDAKSAIRFLRQNAAKFNIDPQRLAAGGGSAGGHIAAAADLTSLEDPHDDLAVSARPNALVLFNPVFNNGPGEFGYDRVGERYLEISPYHNIKKDGAPTIAFFGSNDQLVPTATARLYKKKMEDLGNRCDLFVYDGQKHGFFNYKAGGDNKYFEQTMQEAIRFLKSLGYIK